MNHGSTRQGITTCAPSDVERIREIINLAAEAYRGVIPAACFHEPYMGAGELDDEIAAGVRFSGWREDGRLVGVMGIQDVDDVTLIRHAYVEPAWQRAGIGAALLDHLRRQTGRAILIGTWKAATWAIGFYEKHGFERASEAAIRPLLQRYWTVPEAQVENSCVLVEARFSDRFNAAGAGG
jgi:GNAT superfamily N-acetyltransferase